MFSPREWQHCGKTFEPYPTPRTSPSTTANSDTDPCGLETKNREGQRIAGKIFAVNFHHASRFLIQFGNFAVDRLVCFVDDGVVDVLSFAGGKSTYQYSSQQKMDDRVSALLCSYCSERQMVGREVQGKGGGKYGCIHLSRVNTP